jgi:undecaprenyl-diphosphatase
MFTLLVQTNYALFAKINGLAGRWSLLDGTMVFCADILVFLWPLLMLLLWGRPRSWRKRPLRPGEAAIIQECRAIVIWIAAACLLAYFFNLFIEHIVFEPRPFITHHVHMLIKHAADASFPSDHSAWSFAVLGMLLFSLPSVLLSAWDQRVVAQDAETRRTFLFPLVLMGIAIVMACSIALARVFVGVHYPGDVIGGAVSGLLAAKVVTQIRSLLSKPTQALIQFAQRLHLA